MLPGTLAEPLGILSPEWRDALLRVAKARQRPHYMPAMLLVVLDLLEEQHLQLPFVPFAVVEPRFQQLLQQRGLPGADKAWDPFFHLSVKAHVWTLWNGDALADFSDLAVGKGRATPRPKSRASLVRRADRACFLPALAAQFATLQGRAPLRERVVELLG